MDLKQLEYFTHVAEAGSFSRAAAQLGVAQPALSRQVRALEVELRETLLLRNGRGVSLTEAGRQLLARSRDILQLVQATRHELGAQRDEPLGHLVVGLPPSLARRLTLPLIELFNRRFPKAKVAVLEGFSVHIAEWIATGRVDLALMYNPEPSTAIEIAPVLEEPLCLVGAKAATPRRPVPFAQLPAYPLIMPQWGHTFRKLMETQAMLSGVHLNVAWEVSSVPTILDLVRRGHGFAALTKSAVSVESEREGLGLTPIVEPTITSTLCLATPGQRRPTALQRQTAEALRELCVGL